MCDFTNLMVYFASSTNVFDISYDFKSSDVPLLIPKELVFNSSLQSHRIFFYTLNYSIERIIKRLTEQPSLLAQRIQSLIQYIYHLDSFIY